MKCSNAVAILALATASPIALGAVQAVNPICFHGGGDELGGGHPTAGAFSYIVPSGKNRLLLVFGPQPYKPDLPKKLSQRASLVSFTYAGKPMQHLPDGGKHPSRGHGHPYLWIMKNPPEGKHDLEWRQFRRDNGGETRMAAVTLTGVNLDKPFLHSGPIPLRESKGTVVEIEEKSKKGGLVISSLLQGLRVSKYPRIMPDPSQTLMWEHSHNWRTVWLVCQKPGKDLVKLKWNKPGGRSISIMTFSINPAHPEMHSEKHVPQKALPKEQTKAEKPGLVAKVFDLSGQPPKPSTNRVNYKQPARGALIPDWDRKKTFHSTKVVEYVNLHPLHYKKLPGKRPGPEGVLGTGLQKNFIIEFKGLLTVPESGSVMFSLLSVDQSQLFINGRLILDNHGNNHNTLKKKVVKLRAGKHAFRLLHVEDTHSFGVSLGWRLPSGFPHQMKRKAPMVNIPASAFTHTDEDKK